MNSDPNLYCWYEIQKTCIITIDLLDRKDKSFLQKVINMAKPRGSDPTVCSDHWDSVLKALANEMNRNIIAYLRQSDDPMTVGDLLSHLALRTDYSREDILVMLHHSHLPTLEQVGLIDFESATGLIEYKGDTLSGELVDTVVNEIRKS